MLLSGDIEGDAAETVATNSKVGDRLKSDVYQISHHGACVKANKCSWLEAIKPHEAFVSHGYNAFKYGHPRSVAILRLLNFGTVTTGNLRDPPHPFMCGKEDQLKEGDICHRIFSTYPRKDEICAVHEVYHRKTSSFNTSKQHILLSSLELSTPLGLGK